MSHSILFGPALPVILCRDRPHTLTRASVYAHVDAIGTRIGLTDIALATDTPSPSGVLDLDERLYLARYTAFDRTLAPPGEELIQIVGACQPHERKEHVRARTDRLLDQVAPGWRGQPRWSLRSQLADATGALDLSGCDRNARPSICQRSGIFIAGDYVAAPGLVADVLLDTQQHIARLAVLLRFTREPHGREVFRLVGHADAPPRSSERPAWMRDHWA